MPNHRDEIYIKQIIDGDSRAYGFLVEKYQAMVFTLCVRMLQDQDDAQDAAQEAFIKCFQSLKSFKGDSKFSTWLYKITYYHCIDVLKRNKKSLTYEIDENVLEGEFAPLDGFLEELDSNETTLLLNTAISNLSPDEQVILQLYYYEELPLKEIAEVVSLTMENVKIKLFRARKKLYTLLKPQEQTLKQRYEHR